MHRRPVCLQPTLSPWRPAGRCWARKYLVHRQGGGRGGEIQSDQKKPPKTRTYRVCVLGGGGGRWGEEKGGRESYNLPGISIDGVAPPGLSSCYHDLSLWSRDCQREREIREDNTLLHRDKDLSTSRLFCISVPDDKHSNTQYIRERKRERETDRQTERHTNKERRRADRDGRNTDRQRQRHIQTKNK